MTPTAKKALIISGVSLAAIGLGFLAYRIYTRWGKEVVKEEYSTVLVKKEVDEDVESVGWDDEETTTEPQDWSETPYEDMTPEQQLEYFETVSGFGDY